MSYGAPFYCSSNWDIYACVGSASQSCYQNSPADTCCGCVNWWEEGITSPPAPQTNACNNENPEWRTNSLPKLEWMKTGCPSAYTYPYDDMSSTFTCNNQVDGINQTDYVIAFCPENQPATQI